MCEESNNLQYEQGTKAKWALPCASGLLLLESNNFPISYTVIVGQLHFRYHIFYLLFNIKSSQYSDSKCSPKNLYVRKQNSSLNNHLR